MDPPLSQVQSYCMGTGAQGPDGWRHGRWYGKWRTRPLGPSQDCVIFRVGRLQRFILLLINLPCFASVPRKLSSSATPLIQSRMRPRFQLHPDKPFVVRCHQRRSQFLSRPSFRFDVNGAASGLRLGSEQQLEAVLAHPGVPQ